MRKEFWKIFEGNTNVSTPKMKIVFIRNCKGIGVTSKRTTQNVNDVNETRKLQEFVWCKNRRSLRNYVRERTSDHIHRRVGRRRSTI